jgi:hypothetical protein
MGSAAWPMTPHGPPTCHGELPDDPFGTVLHGVRIRGGLLLAARPGAAASGAGRAPGRATGPSSMGGPLSAQRVASVALLLCRLRARRTHYQDRRGLLLGSRWDARRGSARAGRVAAGPLIWTRLPQEGALHITARPRRVIASALLPRAPMSSAAFFPRLRQPPMAESGVRLATQPTQ